MVLFYSQGRLCQNLPEERMNECAFQGSPLPTFRAQFTPYLAPPGLAGMGGGWTEEFQAA